MENKALYHKYRPTKFSELVGQEHVKKTIENSVKSNRLKHAYLFCGLHGVGKTTIARLLALVFNCENGPSIDYDITSDICKSIISGNCPDVIELDAASNSSIDEIREIRKLARTNPVMARKKVFIIDEVHALRKDSASALLKILEEPPKNTIFILATTHPQKILPTIHSRCQRFDLKKISTNQMIEHLKNVCNKENIKKVEEEALAIIARAGMGSVRDCLSLLDVVISSASDGKITRKLTEETINYTSMSFFYTLLENILKGKKMETIVHLKKALSSGKDPKEVFYGFLEYIHSIMLSKTLGTDSFLYIEKDILEGWRKQRDSISIENFLVVYNALEQSMMDIHYKPRIDITLDACIIQLLSYFNSCQNE